MRVLQLGPLYNNHLRRWSSHARALGATVCAAGHVRRGRRPVDLAGLAEPVEVLPDRLLDRPPDDHRAWLEDVLELTRPDLVHAHWLPRWAYLAAVVGGPPVLASPWGSDVYLAAGEHRARADRALAAAAEVIARSAHMERELVARGVEAGRIHRVDLGVDLGRFRPASQSTKARLRAELGLPPDCPVILSFRAGTALYNLDVVLQAFARVRSFRPRATLVLARGDGRLAPRAREMLRSLEGVRDAGHVDPREMPSYLGAADAAISIPRSDGSPSSVWEALACGLPVVLSDLPQVAERVGGCEAVRLVPPRAEPVAAALLELLEGGSRLARAAHAWAETHFDERDQVGRLALAYRALTAPKSARAPARPAAA
jgi:glycosyltransferase involved in cell wall biosynthesis